MSELRRALERLEAGSFLRIVSHRDVEIARRIVTKENIRRVTQEDIRYIKAVLIELTKYVLSVED